MTEIEVDPAQLSRAGQDITVAGRDVADSTTRLADLVTAAGQAAGDQELATTAAEAARRLGQLVLGTGQVGIQVGAQVALAAAGYQHVERANGAALMPETPR